MFKERYDKQKELLLNDKTINESNREIIKEFLEKQEKKLRRRQGLSEVDERSYKTLYFYIGRLRRLNKWFDNRDWKTLTKEDIHKFIDDLEDGIIKTSKGTRFADRSLYFQMIKGRLFDIAGISNYAQEIFREEEVKGRNDVEEVKFIEEDTFRKIVDCVITPEQKCLLWLAFDIGENIGSLLELEKKDFQRSINSDTKEPEYLVILSKEKLKRSRTPRSEITNYQESVRYLDIVLDNVKPTNKIISNKYMKDKKLSDIHSDNKLFKFSWKTAERFLKRAVKLSNARCIPSGAEVTWKDLRSSMSCDLLKKGYSRDEVNARLGHKPSSRIIDRYINFLALDRKKPQKKIYDSNIKKLESELEDSKELGKLQSHRIEKQKEDIEQLKKDMEVKDKKISIIIEGNEEKIKSNNEMMKKMEGYLKMIEKLNIPLPS